MSESVLSCRERRVERATGTSFGREAISICPKMKDKIPGRIRDGINQASGTYITVL